MSCRYVSRTEPRILPGRHEPGCYGDCDGCAPCAEGHCRVCGITHILGTCAECLGATRADLHAIGAMCGALPTEAAHRGINSEAMVLWGPTADPEQRGHVEASYLAGRLPEGWIEAAHGKDCPRLVNEACTGCAGGELHPLLVLGSWDAIWRDALEHAEPAETLTVASAVAYIDQQMTYMAQYPHVPFEDFARDVRRCAAHLEAVLHDGEQLDTGAPCMMCGRLLTKLWSKDGEDSWVCDRCHRGYTANEYRLAVAHLHREAATDLTARDAEIRTGVKAGTIRAWASRGQVRQRLDSGRVLYSVADIQARMSKGA